MAAVVTGADTVAADTATDVADTAAATAQVALDTAALDAPAIPVEQDPASVQATEQVGPDTVAELAPVAQPDSAAHGQAALVDLVAAHVPAAAAAEPMQAVAVATQAAAVTGKLTRFNKRGRGSGLSPFSAP
jgi:hypothetical protein